MSGNQGFRGWPMANRTGTPLVFSGFTTATQIPTHADVVLLSQSTGNTISSCWLEPGQYSGQRCMIVNISPNVSDEITLTGSILNFSPVFGGDRAILKVNQSILFTWVDFTQVSDYKASSGYIGLPSTEIGGWYYYNPNAYRALGTQTLTNNSSIVTAGSAETKVIPVTCSAAVTGIAMFSGYQGQEVTVINLAAAANTITFDVSGTSNVADGTSDVISGGTARRFITPTGVLWYPLK